MVWRPRALRHQMGVLVAALFLLFLGVVAATGVLQARIGDTQARLTGSYRPAQVAVAGLTQAYADQEAGERGFLLTGDVTALDPYWSGTAEASTHRYELDRALAGDPTAERLLARLDQAAATWRTESAEPDIAQVQRGALVGSALASSALASERRFADVRTRLVDLQEYVRRQSGDQVDAINGSQTAQNRLVIGSAVAAIALGVVAIVVLRNSLYRPLSRLVTSVRHVSAGHWDQSVAVTGPEEVATTAAAVETMRLRILEQTARSAAAQEQLARFEEAERIAFDLNDTVVAELFRTSLAVQSVASRYPVAADELTSVSHDLHRIIRELQAVASGAGTGPSKGAFIERVMELIDDCARGRGSAPRLHLEGDVTGRLSGSLADDVIDVLRRVLRVEPVRVGSTDLEISLSESEESLLLRLTAQSREPSSEPLLAGVSPDLDERAQRLGGTCAIRRRAGVEIIEWTVPTTSTYADRSGS